MLEVPPAGVGASVGAPVVRRPTIAVLPAVTSTTFWLMVDDTATTPSVSETDDASLDDLTSNLVPLTVAIR